VNNEFFKKYDVPAPRYTSYPTVPYWQETPTAETWTAHLRKALEAPSSQWSCYLHIPFCENLCTYCGCNTLITKDHKKEHPYIEQVLKEWNLYLQQVPELESRSLRHLHLGGGTPTFLSVDSLKALLEPFLSKVKKSDSGFEGSIEVDPRHTSREQLAALRELGFNRVSMGVQDFNLEVQKLVNRIQPFEITAELTKAARDLGYESVNFDLIYGLAKQNLESMQESMDLTIQLRPDRIALYSLALVPWIKPAQRLFKDEDLPTGAEKRALYEYSRQRLLSAGYVEVGMDHFALPNEALAKAMANKTLHRNFMGYTDVRTDVLLGLGVSSISETPWSFHQNEKVLPQYERMVGSGEIPTLRGHVLSKEDILHRGQVLELMTKFQVEFSSADQKKDAEQFLAEMAEDQLIEIQGQTLRITEAGRPFLRNACVFFDQHLRKSKPDTQIFSKSI